MNELREELQNLKGDHTKKGVKTCRHCILRYKKSKKILNIFIGDLNLVSGNFEQSTFAELYENWPRMMLDQKKSGISFSIQHYVDRQASGVGDICGKITFLSITQDVGIFKNNIMVHMCPSFPENTENDNSQSNIHGNAQSFLEFYPTIPADNNFLMNLDDNFWKYFREQEKKHFEAPDYFDSKSDLSIKKESQIEQESQSFDKMKAYILLMRKKNTLKELLKDFEVGTGARDYEINRFLLKANEISINLPTPRDITTILNVSIH